MKYLTRKKGTQSHRNDKRSAKGEQALRMIHDLDYTSFELGDFRIRVIDHLL